MEHAKSIRSGPVTSKFYSFIPRRFSKENFLPRFRSTNNFLLVNFLIHLSVHYPGLFKKSSRVWSDLTDDSVTWYKSSSTLYKPIGACRLSQVKEVLEYNEDEPYIVRLNLIDGRKRILELDTAESAMGWRNDIEATVFSEYFLLLSLILILC